MKVRGVRRRGKAIVRWEKMRFYHEPLTESDNRYLDELVEVRAYLMAGKGSEEKHDEKIARQWNVQDFLYIDGVDTDNFVCKCEKYCK